MPSNKNYEEDVRYTIQPNRYMLLSLGVWPPSSRKSESLLRQNSRHLLIILNFLIILCVVIPGILHISLIEKTAYGRLRVAVPVMYSSMTLAKYSILVFCTEQTESCLKHVKEDWKNANDECTRDTMRRNARIGRRFFAICGGLMYGSGFTYRAIVPLIKEKIVINENLTIRPLPCPCYFVFLDPQVSPAYEIVYFLQCLSGFITYGVTTAVCGLAALFVMHTCGQLEILAILMNRMVEKTDPGEDVHTKVAATVEHQIRVRSFLRTLDDTLQKLCLIEVMGCTLIVCLLAYNIMTEWGNHNFAIVCINSVALSSIICNIFMFCYIGEQLTLQAENVARTLRMLDWYYLPRNKVRCVILMIAISNRSMRITAGNIVDLSLQTFGNVSNFPMNFILTVTESTIRGRTSADFEVYSNLCPSFKEYLLLGSEGVEQPINSRTFSIPLLLMFLVILY
ncbi:hypothetical protein KPH14_009201 [Odynerus spinipes]|uniref:Odorant receptor n=1 Tax=Odynerus spinipes TaxID=1348599 RepID=A0AAD9RP16_9HYME|nr:hypothetical protein KPH14_009201 [Odynerus spinipes]